MKPLAARQWTVPDRRPDEEARPIARLRPMDDATAELLRRINEAWPDHVNRWRLSLGGGVLFGAAVYLVAFVAYVRGTPTHMLKMTLIAAGVACVFGPASYHLLCAIVPRRALIRDIRRWTFELCKRHSLSPVEAEALLRERAAARIRELELT
ncbi:MAG: hypothetical protein ACJ790_15215 [Myxococcaceae bacterium]